MNLKGFFKITFKKGEDIVKDLQKPENWQTKYIGPNASKITLGKVRVEKV